MKKFLHSRNRASKGAALIIVLAFVVLVTALVVAHFSRTTSDRQLAQSSFNDTSADLLARSALDITVSDLKQEIAAHPTPTAAPPYYIQPARYPAGIPDDNPNLIRYSSRNAAASRGSTVSSTAASANGRSISLARWNSHYLIPRASTTIEIDSTPVASFIPPDWVLVTGQGPTPSPSSTGAVIGRYAFAVYDEGGLLDMNLGGFPNYASLTLPTRPTRRLAAKYPVEESEIMLVANPNPPCQVAKFTPDHINESGGTGAPFAVTPNTNGSTPKTFSADFLPHGLTIDPSTGTIFGVPTSPGTFTVTLSVSNACGGPNTATLNLTIDGRFGPDSTPWPVNVARKGIVAFADATTLPSTPTAITPTTTVGSMGGFPSTTQIDKIMGWRNYATTQQAAVSFDNPIFALGSADNYAKYFLGGFPPPDYLFQTRFTTVRNDISPVNGRTDQAVMTRQELIKLQRTIGFSQSLLQYLGTFSSESNRPAPDWPSGNNLTTRFDMNNLQGVIPNSWLFPGHHGIGHAFGIQRHSMLAQQFGLQWVDGNFVPGTRNTDPNYYGHWKYPYRALSPLPANPDFFQIIDYAMNQANGGVVDPNHVRNTFTVGAALIDQYDTDDLFDPDPNPPANGNFGNTITIIDTVGAGNPADYVYGIEGLSFDDPTLNLSRPGPYCAYPPPVPSNYVLLNRRFENVGEFGYAYNPVSTLASKTLDFASSTSKDKPMLDFFTYNTGTKRAGIVNLNTRNGPVLASIIRGALLHDFGAEVPPTSLASRDNALAAAQLIVQETTSTTAGRGPALTRGDVARLAAAAAAALPVVPGVPVSEVNQTIARALAEAGQARTWNLMIDVIAQTGNYAPGTPDLTDPTKFIVQGEKRYWLHIALDRDNGTVLGTQLEEVVE